MNNYIQIIAGFSPLLVIMYMLWKDTRSGNKEMNTETVQGYKDRDILRLETIQRLNTEIANCKADKTSMKESFIKETGELRGIIKGKDDKITELQTTVENRNPNLEKILENLANTNSKILTFMEALTKTNLHQSEMIEGQVRRENKQDTATDAEVGPVMRKEFKQ